MARSRGRRTAAGLTVTVLLLAGGYAAADAADLVPGVLTTAPPVPDPAPFPEATAEAAEPLLPALDPAAPLPSAEAVTALTEELVADPRTGGAVAVVVRDALTEEVLADVAGDEPRTPASSLKLLGAVAALDALGPDHVLRTTAVEGEDDQVVLVGGGDILLTDGEASDDVVGHASLEIGRAHV